MAVHLLEEGQWILAPLVARL